jgi:hypothetical protein
MRRHFPLKNVSLSGTNNLGWQEVDCPWHVQVTDILQSIASVYHVWRMKYEVAMLDIEFISWHGFITLVDCCHLWRTCSRLILLLGWCNMIIPHLTQLPHLTYGPTSDSQCWLLTCSSVVLNYILYHHPLAL